MILKMYKLKWGISSAPFSYDSKSPMYLLDSLVFGHHILGIFQSTNVGFHEGEVQTVIGSLGLGCLVLLLLDDQREVGVGGHLSGQFFILSTEALTSLVKAGLGAGDGLFEEVDGKADSGLGGSSGGIHSSFLSGSLGLGGRSQPLFLFF